MADRATREPFDPGLKLNQKIKAVAFESGLGCYPGGGTADGRRGDHVLLAPPFIVTADEIDEIVTRLSGAIDASVAAVASREVVST